MSEENRYRGSDDGYDPRYARAHKGKQMAGTAFFLSIAALLSTLLMTIVLPYVLAPVAVVLAFLSRGEARRMEAAARRAAIISAVALAVNTVMVGGSYYVLFTDAGMRETANRMTRQMYGYSFDDMLELLEQQYGIDLGANGNADAAVQGIMEGPAPGDDTGTDDGGTGFYPDGTPISGENGETGASGDEAGSENKAGGDGAGQDGGDRHRNGNERETILDAATII
ncbi:hypothetical protein [Lachnoclostridium sp. Marseille-P6806]|uniref:hypothetical protein n=1 Tax=Lachnoclostridium sp. Marseille-P6806 TaxID=2364793 RepID=UPI0013EF2F8D|nr:hypothetical protein [Lachnoclostridium sp. Marseille-P6806]